jgi:proline dehydrogenase
MKDMIQLHVTPGRAFIYPCISRTATCQKWRERDEIDMIGNNRLIGCTVEDNRWTVPDLAGAMEWCGQRARQHIRCTLAITAEYAKTPEESHHALVSHLAGIRAAGEQSKGISFSVKPSAIGILFDHGEYIRNLSLLFHEALDRRVPFEIDMEGRPLVGDTLRSALTLAAEGNPLTVALQAYLNRTSNDLAVCMAAGISVRLVKGAYQGDTGDFITIQQKFRTHTETLISAGAPFCAATHDPVLINWLKEAMHDHKNLIEFAFLKGLANQTKTEMAADGWKVAEYVPYGPGGQAYIQRRERYLASLEHLGRLPVP